MTEDRGEDDLLRQLRAAEEAMLISQKLRQADLVANQKLREVDRTFIASLMRERDAARADVRRLRELTQNNAHSWDTIVKERDMLRRECARLATELEQLRHQP